MKPIIALLLWFISTSISAQTASIRIEYGVNPYFKDRMKNEVVEIEVSRPVHIHNDSLDDIDWIPIRTVSIKSSQTIVVIDSLPAGNLVVTAHAPNVLEELQQYVHDSIGYFLKIDKVTRREVSLTAGKTYRLNSIVVPDTCRFQSNTYNNKCPECKKHDRVIPIVYAIHPRLGKKAKSKKLLPYRFGGFDFNCSPNWYCERDKLEF